MIELDRDQQKKVLTLARNTIAEKLAVDEPINEPDFSDAVFQEECGSFVTLHIRGQLRGCIGYIQGVKNIPDTVRDMALASAFRDPRFPKLRRDEFDLIDIEVSVLSPIEEVKDVSEIVPGRDGIIITRGQNTGLLLPQVATEQGWDLETFLENTCYKAGLPGNTWKLEGVKIEKFSAQVFGEKELGLA